MDFDDFPKGFWEIWEVLNPPPRIMCRSRSDEEEVADDEVVLPRQIEVAQLHGPRKTESSNRIATVGPRGSEKSQASDVFRISAV